MSRTKRRTPYTSFRRPKTASRLKQNIAARNEDYKAKTRDTTKPVNPWSDISFSTHETLRLKALKLKKALAGESLEVIQLILIERGYGFYRQKFILSIITAGR